MYKASIFNTVFSENERLLLFNSRSKRYLKTERYVGLVKEVLENPDHFMENPVFSKLKDAGMLVEDTYDESQSFDFWKNDYIYNPQLHICILPTEQCNLRCTYCYEDFQNGAMTQATQDAFILWLKRNLKNYTSLRIEWFGGEPLVAKDIIFNLSERIIAICHQARKPFTASIVTNGTLMDLETFKKLLSCHVINFQVTIDGVKETHDALKIRADGQGTYDCIIRNLLSIKNGIRSSSSFSIAVRTNATMDVVNQLPDHLHELSKMFGDDQRFSFYFRPVGHWAKQQEFSFEEALLKEFNSLYQPIIDAAVPLNYAIYAGMLEDHICSAAKRNYFVLRSNGGICKCTMLLQENENHIGELLDNGTMVLNEQKLQKWLPIQNTTDDCLTCTFAPTCFGVSCPAKNFLLPKSGQCGYEVAAVSYIMQLLDQGERSAFEWIENEEVF